MPKPRPKKPEPVVPKSTENLSKKPEKTVEEKSKAPPSKEVSIAPKEVPKEVVPAPAPTPAPPPAVEAPVVKERKIVPLPKMTPINVVTEPKKKRVDDKHMNLVEDHYHSLMRRSFEINEGKAREIRE